MKRFFLLLTVTVLLLSACTAVNLDEMDSVYTYTKNVNGVTYTVTPGQQTITDGVNTYRYEETDTTVTVIYPNGATYKYRENGLGVTLNGNIPTGMAEGYVLVDLVPTRANPVKRMDGGKVAIALVIVLLGLFYAIFPKIAWFIRYGWTYKNPEYAEPSDAFVLFGRISGIVIIIAGIVLMVGAYQ